MGGNERNLIHFSTGRRLTLKPVLVVCAVLLFLTLCFGLCSINPSTCLSNASIQVQVLAVFDSKHGIVGEEKAGAASSPAALPSHVLKEIIRAKEEKRSLESMKQEDGIFSVDSNEKAWGDVVAKMASDHPSLANVVVADCTANETGHVLKEALDKGMGVVLANKKPISGPQAAFEYFMQCDPFFRWESTVGAGSPFITTFKRLVAGGDKVKKVSDKSNQE